MRFFPENGSSGSGSEAAMLSINERWVIHKKKAQKFGGGILEKKRYDSPFPDG